MPRGGDKYGQTDARRGIHIDEQAVGAFDAAMMSQYGIHPNAEAMIQSHKAMRDPALQKLLLIPEVPEESEKARKDLEAVAKKLGLDTSKIVPLDAAVRGNGVVLVYEDEYGNYVKAAGAWNDQYVAPKLSVHEEAERAELEASRQIADETARLRAEVELKAAELRQDIEVQFAEQLAQVRENAKKQVDAVVAEAQEQIEKAKATKRKPASGASKRKKKADADGKKPSGGSAGVPPAAANRSGEPDETEGSKDESGADTLEA